ncbi:MAG: hypothetical protein ACRERR_02055 [Moraxellaceae bacterium]
MKIKILLFIIAVQACLVGCANQFFVPEYRPARSTVLSSTSSALSPTLTYSIADVQQASNVSSSILCRLAGGVEVPRKMSFAQYVEGALRQELSNRNMYAAGSPSALSIVLNELDFRSTEMELSFSQRARWVVSMSIRLPDKSFELKSNYDFMLSHAHSNIACREVANALPLALRDSLQKLLYQLEQ